MKKVSVILTTYNGQGTIGNTLDSILKQDGLGNDFELEVIVVDDCSTDDTVKVVQQYDVILLSTKMNSGGPNRGRNIGLKRATGDYISISDQDDIWKTNRMISLLPYCKEFKIVSSGFTLRDTSTGKEEERSSQSLVEKVKVYPRNATFLSKLTRSKTGQNSYLGSVLFSNEFKNVLFEEQFGMIDYDWGLRLFYEQESLEVCESLYYRLVDTQNLSLNENYRKVNFYYSLYSIEQYDEQFPDAVKEAYYNIHGTRARYYYFIGNMKKARFYFLRSGINLKSLLYILTSYVGHEYVRKKFNVFV